MRARRRRELRLGWVLVLAFAVLSTLPLALILAYGYRRNQAAIEASLDEQLARGTTRDLHRIGELVDQVGRAAAVVGEAVKLDPSKFHSEAGDDVIWRTVANLPQLDALYVSFEDGHHRVVSRIDEARRAHDPQIPAAAAWHASYIDALSTGEARKRHRRFYAEWGTPLPERYDAPPFDVRTMPTYVAAKATHRIAIVDPIINPDTGAPILNIGWPIVVGGEYLGFVGANMTLTSISTYLRDNRFSAHSVTVIVDDQQRVIAHPDAGIVLSQLGALADKRLAEASQHRSTAPYRFEASTGEELAVTTVPFPAAFAKPWHVMIVAPTDDFVGELVSTNRTVFALIAIAVAIELALIYLLSRYIGGQIARISALFNDARRLSFVDGTARRSFINELADLQGGFALLQNALSSFSKFVPRDVVRQFIESGEPITPGVQQLTATIFFCDLEGFSGQAETLTPDRLLAQLTQYFATMTGAIAGEGGTIDKFIGDAVMAFWGAPTAYEDHALRACIAAIRAKRRMEKLQATWVAEGHPVMKVRIGLHSSAVLVGNVGSPERLSYTAIGDGVNVASRLEGINKELGSTVCVSEAVIAALAGRAIARPLRSIRVKGRRAELMVYELLAITGTTDPELAPREGDTELVALSTAAAETRTADAYHAVLAKFPDDRVTQLLLAQLGAS